MSRGFGPGDSDLDNYGFFNPDDDRGDKETPIGGTMKVDNRTAQATLLAAAKLRAAAALAAEALTLLAQCDTVVCPACDRVVFRDAKQARQFARLAAVPRLAREYADGLAAEVHAGEKDRACRFNHETR